VFLRLLLHAHAACLFCLDAEIQTAADLQTTLQATHFLRLKLLSFLPTTRQLQRAIMVPLLTRQTLQRAMLARQQHLAVS
jgi:hypothetical protein